MSVQSSSKLEPLKFFISFLKKVGIDKYEYQFYEIPRNVSQVKNRSQGYIEYEKAYYIDDEEPLIRIYFNDELKSLIDIQTKNSYNLLINQKRELHYFNNSSNKFLDDQLILLIKLINRAKKLRYNKIIVPELQVLQVKIELLIAKNTNKPFKPQKKIRGVDLPTFFGNKNGTNKKFLKRVYLVLTTINILSKYTTSENDFIEVLTSSNPSQLEFRIIFNKDNYHSIYFLKFFSVYFDNFTWSKISESKSFLSKGKTVFNQNLLDKYTSTLKKKSVEKYLYINDAFESLD